MHRNSDSDSSNATPKIFGASDSDDDSDSSSSTIENFGPRTSTPKISRASDSDRRSMAKICEATDSAKGRFGPSLKRKLFEPK